jgi:hypothetical protein
MTQATPMMIPSAVRPERSLLRPIDCIATFKIVSSLSIIGLPAGLPRSARP